MQSIKLCTSTCCTVWMLAALTIFSGVTTGCGRASNAVSRLTGAVTLDGKPLPQDASGSVTFRPIGEVGGPVSAQIIQGRYECANVPRGEVLAMVTVSVPTGRKLQGDLRAGETGTEFESVVLSPDQASGIKLQVTDDANVDFELTQDKR